MYRHLNYNICGEDFYLSPSAVPVICQKAGLDYNAEVAKVISRDVAGGESALSEMIRNAIINNAKKIVDPCYKQDKLIIPHKLTAEEEATLTTTFPELCLEFKHKIFHPHAFAAASRLIEEQINIGSGLEKLNSTPIPEGYDVLVKDSGGDPFKQISRGRVNFHSCPPLLTIYDQQRDASRKAAIATMQKLSSKQNQALRKYNEDIMNNTNKFSCRNVYEHCSVKAPFMLFLHSTYDRTTTDIANAMTAGDCKVATGSFIFSTQMLTQNEGIISELGSYYNITIKNKVKYLNMSFKCDSSWSHTHRLDTYLSILTHPVIKDSNGQHYFINILSIRNSIVFFKIIRNAAKNVLPGEITLRLWFDN